MSVEPDGLSRYPQASPGSSGFPPGGGTPPPGGNSLGLIITVRAACILGLSAAVGALTGLLYLGPARVTAAVVAAVLACGGAVRVFSRIIR
jgi:hypothetical protein